MDSGPDITPTKCMAYLRRRPGRWTVTDDVLRAAKIDPKPFDHHAMVVWSMSRLEEHDKIRGDIDPKTKRWGWWLPVKDEETGAMLGPVY